MISEEATKRFSVSLSTNEWAAVASVLRATILAFNTYNGQRMPIYPDLVSSHAAIMKLYGLPELDDAEELAFADDDAMKDAEE